MRHQETWTTATVIATRDIAPRIREISLRPDGAPARYPLGSHIRVAVSIDGRPDTRSYSLVGAPGGDAYRIAVRLSAESRGGSRYMWSLREGARIAIAEPRSLLQVGWQRPHYCLIAGGIGITPLVGAAQMLARRDAGLELHYAVAAREDAAYFDDLIALLGSRLHLYARRDGRRLDLPATFAALPAGAVVLFCGPLRMLEAARAVWAATGRPAADFCTETFGSSGHLATESFHVRLRDGAAEYLVPRDRSMLDVLRAAGHDLISDCERGECGVCAVDVLAIDGSIDHRDVFFSADQKRESRKICPCVSRAHGSLTLDTLLRPDAP